MRILHVIDAISEWAGKVVGFLLLFLVGSLVYEVILRYVFNSPTFWSYDISMFAFGTAGLIAGAYTLRYRAHINIDILYVRLSPRRRAILDVVTASIFFFFCLLVIWQGGKMALYSLAAREVTLTAWHPILYPFKMVIPVAGFMVLLQGIANFVRDLHFAIHEKELS